MIRRSVLLFLATPGAAAAMVHDVLPLAHGTYVADGVPCADPPFAALRTYDGRGLGGAHSRDCRARIVARRGRTVTLANDCVGAGAGPAPRVVERTTIRLLGRTRFAIDGTRFRLCPARYLPSSLRALKSRST